MRVTMVSRYFFPEVVLANEIASWLIDAGLDVTVLTGQPDYNPEAGYKPAPTLEIIKGVRIERFSPFRVTDRGWRRNLNSLLFVFHAAWRISTGPKTDVVWSSTIPPIVQPLLLRIASRMRGARFLYYPQDIYPDIACATDLLTDGWFASLLKSIDAWTLKRSDAVVTLSNDMLNVLESRGADPSRAQVIRSFAAEKVQFEPYGRDSEAPCRFVYAGNIGRFQNLEALVRVFARIDPSEATLEMLGDGREKEKLQSWVTEHRVESVTFHDSLPADAAAEFVANCDAGIVALLPEIYRYAFPAKFYTYLGAGVPILALIEPRSELARLVLERELGTVVGWDNGDKAIDHAVREIIRRREEFRSNVLGRSSDLHCSDIARQKWVDVFTKLTNTSQRSN